MFPGARSSPTDHVKRPRANPGAENVQACMVIPVDEQAAGRTRMRAHGERLRNQLSLIGQRTMQMYLQTPGHSSVPCHGTGGSPPFRYAPSGDGKILKRIVQPLERPVLQVRWYRCHIRQCVPALSQLMALIDGGPRRAGLAVTVDAFHKRGVLQLTLCHAQPLQCAVLALER
jgi:hypothetical protein